ncbi:MAG: phosphate ABC transporter substrate-binding protein [Myxococcota bacterium]
MLALLLLACTPRPPAVELTLAGASTIQPVVEIAGQAFEAAHPGARIDVQGGGSSVGISSTRSGLAAIGTVSRPLKPEESDLTATTIGLDGIAVIVHADNPMTAITKEQVVSVYTGATNTWTALGWDDHAITLVNKEEGRSTRELFEGFFLLKDRFAANAVIIGPNGQAITTVAGNPYAIAYVSIGSAAFAETQGATIKRLSLDGVAATVENVANETYPLMRPLNLVTKGPPTGGAKVFIDFVLSAEGQAIVRKEDFVPVAATPRPLAVDDASATP